MQNFEGKRASPSAKLIENQPKCIVAPAKDRIYYVSQSENAYMHTNDHNAAVNLQRAEDRTKLLFIAASAEYSGRNVGNYA